MMASLGFRANVLFNSLVNNTYGERNERAVLQKASSRQVGAQGGYGLTELLACNKPGWIISTLDGEACIRAAG